MKIYLYRKKELLKRKLFRFLNGSCTVLLYHRVIDSNFDPQGLSVSTEKFEEQLSSLKKDHQFLSIDEFYVILKNKKKFPKNSLLISFDDGYADNYYNALPVLERLKLPAVFYIATKNLDTNNLFWWDELDLIFKRIHEANININELKRKHQLSDAARLYDFYLVNCKTASSLTVRKNYMDELRNLVAVENEQKKSYQFLKREELVKMSYSKQVIIGAHTINHLSLGHLSETDQKNEIEGSVRELETILGKKIEHFAFPYGEKHNYNQITIELCAQNNLKSAAANYCDYVTNKSDLLSFPRFVVRNDEPQVLRKKLRALV